MNYQDIKLKIIANSETRTLIGANNYYGLMDVFGSSCGGHDSHFEISSRLISAWNYCEGVPTSELESGGSSAGFWGRAASRLKSKNDKLKADNDALRAAVKEMERILPVLEQLENEFCSTWQCVTAGTGIATTNAYRQTLEKALAQITTLC